MLQSANSSDQKQSIFNSLHSQGVVKSISLNSGVKLSQSKRLFTQDSGLQMSVSSDSSRNRSYSMQSQRPTVTRQQLLNQSVAETAKQEPTEAKFVTLSREENVQEFKFEQHSQVRMNFDFQNKVKVLIDENTKLISINEELMSEIERLKQQSNNSVFISSYQREIQNLQSTLKQYKQINTQQSQQIIQLQSLLNQREELQIEQIQLSTNRANNQVLELQSQNRLLGEQFMQLSTKYLLKCFELERILKQGNTEKQWMEKVNILLQENETLNQMVQQRLQEAEFYQKKQLEYEQRIREQQMQLDLVQSNWQSMNDDFQKQLKLYNDTTIQQEKEIQLLQQQITEHNYMMTRKNNDQVQLLQEVNKKYEQKNDEVNKLSLLLQEQEHVWRQKCLEFEKEMKQSYSNKLKQEVSTKTKTIIDDFHKQLLQYQHNAQLQQAQIQQVSKQNDHLSKLNQEFHITLNTLNAKNQQLVNEKASYLDVIKQLQAQLGTIQTRQRSVSHYQYDSEFSSLGVEEQQKHLKENVNLNNKVMLKCKQLLNKRFQV